MHDPAENLVKMANQIGHFFESQTENDAEATAQAVASHLKLFWAPAMREQLLAHVEQNGNEGLMPVVELALQRHAKALRSSRGAVPAESGEVFPEGGGDAG